MAPQSPLSVVICTHNPRPDYLTRVLGSLRTQTHPSDGWELLVVDNASDTPLPEDTGLAGHLRARVVREERLGVGFARVRAMTEASGDLIVHVDDDNVLASDYLANVVRIARDFPFLGAFGAGSVIPEFETGPEPWCSPYLPMLALRVLPRIRWSNSTSDSDATPFGAGMCVRRPVADHFCRKFAADRFLQEFGTKGKSGASGDIRGEDELMAWSGRDLGYGWGNFPELAITHLIPRWRVTESYLLRMVERQAKLGILLRYAMNGELPAPYGIEARTKRIYHNLRLMLTSRFLERRAYEGQMRGFASGREALRAQIALTGERQERASHS
jgi:glycosyltransferase involved in cell wall biosynthesis